MNPVVITLIALSGFISLSIYKAYYKTEFNENRPYQKFTELTKDHIVYHIKDYILIDPKAGKFLNKLYKELN